MYHIFIRFGYIILCLILLFGCSNAVEEASKIEKSNATFNLQIPLQVFPESGVLTAYYQIDGDRTDLTISDDKMSASGSINVNPGTYNIEIGIEYIADAYGMVVLATSQIEFAITQDETKSIVFMADDYTTTYDDDQDSFSNIVEVAEGSNPKDSGDKPATEFDAPTTSVSQMGGDYTVPLNIVLTCDDGATGSGCENIYYTVDGTTPTVSSTVYTSPILLSNITTLSFFSQDLSGNSEAVKTEVFNIVIVGPQTIATPNGGVFPASQSISLDCVSACENIYFTTDGTTPTINSTLYTVPIVLSNDTVLKYFSVDGLGALGPVSTSEYFFDSVAPVTVADIGSGVYKNAQVVTLSCSDTGSGGCFRTYYTIDGSLPTTNSPVYSGVINIAATNVTTTLQYFSLDGAGNTETTRLQSYTIDTIPPATTASILAGTYPVAQTVSLTCVDYFASSGCKSIHYTLDGSEPSISSPVYTGPISITSNTLLRFYSIDNVNNSESTLINSKYYIIALPAIGTSTGPEGGLILDIAVDPVNPEKIYAGTAQGGVFKSNNINNSPNWLASGLGNNSVFALTIDPSNPLILYASVSYGAYKSINGGISWQQISTNSSLYNALDPANSDKLYLATSNGILLSLDAGATFNPKTLSGSTVTKIAIDSTGSIIYAGTSSGLFKSVNSGEAWVDITSVDFQSTYIRDVEIDPNNVNTVYVVTSSNMYKSIDAGVTWSDLGATRALNLIILPTNSNILYTAEDGFGISKSEDGGSTWVRIYSGGARTIEFASLDGNVLYAGLNSNGFFGVYKSIDAGLTWNPWSKGLIASTVYRIDQDPTSPGTLYAGASGIGLYKTQDEGANWVALDTYTQTYGSSATFSDISIDPNDPSNIYVSNSRAGINQTIDGGSTWTTTLIDTASEFSNVLVFDKLNAGLLYAGVYSSSIRQHFVYKSTDNGTTWMMSSNGLPQNNALWTLSVDPVSANILYIAGRGVGADLYKSYDAGLSWSGLGTGYYNIDSFAINPSDSNELYLGVIEGYIYKSNDGGVSWVTVASGLNGDNGSSVGSIKFSPINTNIVYAGTKGNGLFRTSNAGKDWSPVIVSNMNTQNIQDMRINPNNDNIVYAGTSGGGVWRIEVTP